MELDQGACYILLIRKAPVQLSLESHLKILRLKILLYIKVYFIQLLLDAMFQIHALRSILLMWISINGRLARSKKGMFVSLPLVKVSKIVLLFIVLIIKDRMQSFKKKNNILMTKICKDCKVLFKSMFRQLKVWKFIRYLIKYPS